MNCKSWGRGSRALKYLEPPTYAHTVRETATKFCTVDQTRWEGNYYRVSQAFIPRGAATVSVRFR